MHNYSLSVHGEHWDAIPGEYCVKSFDDTMDRPANPCPEELEAPR